MFLRTNQQEVGMKKILIVLLAIIGFSSLANAQNFTVRFGPQLILAPSVAFAIDANVQGKELSRFSSNLSLGLNGNFFLVFGNGVGYLISVGPTLNIEFNPKGDVFFGFNLGIANASFIFAFVSGVHYFVTPTINLFANLGLIVVPGIGGSFDFGADFRLARDINLYGKFVIGLGNGSFGLGTGLTFRF
jgi:hypothetical protein